MYFFLHIAFIADLIKWAPSSTKFHEFEDLNFAIAPGGHETQNPVCACYSCTFKAFAVGKVLTELHQGRRNRQGGN